MLAVKSLFFLVVLLSCQQSRNLRIRQTEREKPTEESSQGPVEPSVPPLQDPSQVIEKPKPEKPALPPKLQHFIVFVRHAESCQNVPAACSNVPDENRLTGNGKMQAQELTRILDNLNKEQAFNVIYTSEKIRATKSIQDFVDKNDLSHIIVKDARLNECSGPEVGCYSDNGDGQSFKTSIKNLLAQAKTSKNILIVGHSRKGYELLKNNFLRTNFASIRSRAISTYLESCYKSGPLWTSCFSKANAGIKYREYSYIHNALPISFNDDEVDFN